MTCFHPIAGNWGPDGRVYFDGRGWRDRPVSVPCGKCGGCRVARAEAWAVRCQHEASQHEENSFVTLTYSPEKLPADWSLRPDDFRLFIRRVRKALGAVRYFHCGEYGEENLRPHYHAILFGQGFRKDRILVRDGSFPLYTSMSLERLWTHGYVTVGDVSFQSAAYVARYCVKKLGAKSPRYSRVSASTGETWSVRPEYCTMSRRPGIGSSWFEKFGTEVFPSDEVIVEGRRRRPPRFYENRLSEEELEEVKRRRIEWMQEHPDRVSRGYLEAKEYEMVQKIGGRPL